MNFLSLIVGGSALMVLWVIWLKIENKIDYTQKQIELNIFDQNLVYIDWKSIWLYPKRHRRILELYKPDEIIETSASPTGFIKIKMDLNNFKTTDKPRVIQNGVDVQGNALNKKVYLYSYEVYDPSSNSNRLEVINVIKVFIDSIGIGSVNIGEINNYEIKWTQINEKVEYISHILEKEDYNGKEQELEGLIKTAIELVKSIPIPYMRTIVTSLELLYKMINYSKNK